MKSWRRNREPWRLGAVAAAIALLLALVSESSRADFATIINLPADPVPLTLGSDTQLNVHVGGALPDHFNAGLADGTSTNIEVNVEGGTVGYLFDAYGGSTINVRSGTVGTSFRAHSGSLLHVLGGTVGNGAQAYPGSTVIVDGGRISRLSALAGSQVTVSNGSLGSNSSLGNSFSGVSTSAVMNLTGGTIGDYFDIYEHGVLNMSGGTIYGRMDGHAGSEINLSGGAIAWYAQTAGTLNMTGGYIDSYFKAQAGSNVLLSGGAIDYGFMAFAGSEVHVSGGLIDGSFLIESGGDLRVSGGTFGDGVNFASGSSAVLVGGEFALDGVPIAGLESIGSTLPFNLPAGKVLTGVFADGTPFAFRSDEGDHFANGVLTLESAALPAIAPTAIISSTDPVPLGIRQGQTLTVDTQFTRTSFVAGPGSTMVVANGGFIDDEAKAVAADVTIQAGGQIDYSFDAMLGSKIHVVGGTLGSQATFYDGSTLNVSSGVLSGAEIKAGSTAHVTGGEIGGLTAHSGAMVHVTGGKFTNAPFTDSGSRVDIAGGVFRPGMTSNAGGQLKIRGSDFRLNGELIAEIASNGDTLPFDLPANSVLTGVLADGSPIALASWMLNSRYGGITPDKVAAGTLTLVHDDPPAPVPTVIHVPSDPAPQGVRAGQTLVVDDGGNVPAQFTAVEGSAIQLRGGQIGTDFEAVGAQVDVTGGILERGTLFHGTQMHVSGGQVNYLFMVEGANLHVDHAGKVNFLFAGAGSDVTIVGGQVNVGGRGFPVSVDAGAQLRFSGSATTSGLEAMSGSEVIVSGGEIIYELDALAGSHVHLIGSEFLLNGAPIDGLEVSSPLVLADRGGTLSGRFPNGKSFEFELLTTNSFRHEYFDPQATLTLSLILPGDYDRNGVVDTADYQTWIAAFGTSVDDLGTGADGNYDGVVDAADYAVWRDALPILPQSLAVPEPTSIVPLLFAAAWLVHFWRLHR